MCLPEVNCEKEINTLNSKNQTSNNTLGLPRFKKYPKVDVLYTKKKHK